MSRVDFVYLVYIQFLFVDASITFFIVYARVSRRPSALKRNPVFFDSFFSFSISRRHGMRFSQLVALTFRVFPSAQTIAIRERGVTHFAIRRLFGRFFFFLYFYKNRVHNSDLKE